MLKLISNIFAILHVVSSLETRKEDLPPYAGDHIDIHIVTHTHDDTGWIITTDEYYIEEVQWIFDTMIPILMANSERKFTYVEMAYFYRWWNEQTEEMKQNVITLVNNGQLELNLGGWCMNDEANPSLSAIVHQMTDGQQFILENFGDAGRPTVGWHVDPFGHSWVTGGLWAEVGFDSFGINRINYNDLQRRKETQDMEFMWKGSTSLGEDGYIFVHLLDNGYCTPGEIDFPDGNVFINTDPNLPTYGLNAYQIAESFISDVRNRLTWYRHNNMLIPYGCDFEHTNAYQSMLQMDKLINYINNNKSAYNTSIFYSTLGDYTKKVNSLNLTWNLEDIDFFNYVSSPHYWWTGYFTSRPQLKGYTRSRENDLRVGDQLYVWGQNYGWNDKNYYNETAALLNITKLRHAIDVSQHHDGITGTETDHTTNDYMTMLSNGTTDVAYWTELVAGRFLSQNGNFPSLERGSYVINELTTDNVLSVVVYNPLAWTVTKIIDLPTNRSDLVVYDQFSVLLTDLYQTNPTPPQSEENSKFILYWLARDLKPLSFTTFFIRVSSNSITEPIIEAKKILMDDNNIKAAKIGSGYYSLVFDTNGFLTNIENNEHGQSFNVHNSWYQYVPSGGIYNDGLENSGAYVFRPAQDNRYCVGSNNGGNENKQETIHFRHEWETDAAYPGFITQAHGDASYSDSYIGTVCSISDTRETFTFNYYRLEGTGWGDSPYFDFIAFDGTYSGQSSYGLLANKQYGTVPIPKPSTQVTTVNVTLPANTFTSPPRFLASVRSSSCGAYSSYTVTVGSVSNTQAIVYVSRVDSATWVENAYLDWMAWEPEDSTEIYTEGRYTWTTAANINSLVRVNISFSDDTKFIVNEPVVFVSMRQVLPAINSESDVRFFTLTTVSNGFESFAAQLVPLNPNTAATGNIQFEITYWAFEREFLISSVAEQTSNTIYEGPLFSEVQQIFKTNYAQSYRVYNQNHTDLRYVDLLVQLGPIDPASEMVTRFNTNLENNYTWWTGQNSVEYVKRVYNPYIDERVAGNFYPTTATAWFSNNDDTYRFSTIVNQAHGVGAYYSNGYELMLHRRCLQDDNLGVNEVLNETTHIEPSIYILLDDSQTVSYLNRRLNMLQQFRPTKFYGISNSIDSWRNSYATNWSAMTGGNYSNGLPHNIHLLTFRYSYSGSGIDSSGLVLQLEHMFETNENTEWSVDETIDLTQIFDKNILTIDQTTEMTLTANLPLSELNRLPWNIATENGDTKIINTRDTIKKRLNAAANNSVLLEPRHIRTFVVNEDVSKRYGKGDAQYHRKRRNY